MENKKNTGFARNPDRARRIARTTKMRQTPEERSKRSRAAAVARWSKSKTKIDGMELEDVTELGIKTKK